MTRNICRNLILKVIVLLASTWKHVEMKRQCIKGMTTPGFTIPSDDIVVEYGKPLDITCILHEEYQNQNPNVSSQDLYFERGGEIIPTEMITVLNATSINLHIDLPQISESVYNCKLKKVGGVCLNTVYVGTQPVLTDDFDCIGFNYEKFTCSWSIVSNPVPTSYSLRYFTGSLARRHLTNDCPYLQKIGRNRMSCTWTLTTQPPYRQALEELSFQLSANNHLGHAELNSTIYHFKRVVPAPPENLTFVNSTADSLLLKWSIPSSMQGFPPGLHHQIMYRLESESEWQLSTILLSQNKTKRMLYNLTNLTHAFAQYEIGIALRSSVADPNDENMWSASANITAKTKSKIPGRPPSTTIGSFEVVNVDNTLPKMRDIFVYWQQISDRHKNGKKFMYIVEVENFSALKPMETTNAYAKFCNMSVDESYTFKIWSSNALGRSENYSKLIVPKQIKGLNGPAHFTKLIRYDHAYDLSWDSLTYPTNNLTIFACMYDRDRPYQCAGFLFWKVISPDKLNYVVKTREPQKIYQFAISANSEEYSSGMVWADCTVISSQVGYKLKNVWIHHVSVTHIVLKWKLDCAEHIGGIWGFTVRYCEYKKFSNDSCDWTDLSLSGLNIEEANITSLSPFTKYVFELAKLTKTGEPQQRSDYIFGTTLESAPTHPTNIKVSNITNSSATISWSNPIATNGIINHFVVFGKNHLYKVNATTHQITINNLTSYTTYNFTVFACTVACSGAAPLLVVKTLGGYPSKINQPGVTFQNDSFTLVEWERPKHPNGDCDVYEIRFKERRRYENKTLTITNTTDTWYVIEDCGSGGRYNTFFISVRAVNILNGTRYDGPWSDELQSFCRQSTTAIWMWILGPSLLILAFLIYLGRRMYYNCQKMRDIEVKLPPGLAAFVIATEIQGVEEVPLKEKARVNYTKRTEDNKNRYLPMEGYAKTNSPSDYANQNEEYVTMGAPTSSSEIRYVQIGDAASPPKRNSIILIANNITINTGYVSVGDILTTQKN